MNLKAVFEQLQGKRIVIIGDVILDTYIWGDVKRISPEAPVPVFETTTEKTGCGGAANVAQNVASLGGNATLVGVIGADREGEKLVQRLTEMNLVTTGVYTDPQRPTSTKTRVIARGATTFPDRERDSGHHLLRIDRESKQEISPQIREHLLDIIAAQLPTSDALIFADYDKGVVTPQLINGVMKHAKSHGIPIVVDPKQNNFWHYEGVTAVTPNHKEASAAVVHEEITDVSDLVAMGEKILDRLSLKALLITRDAKGMSLFYRPADSIVKVEHLPPHSNIVTDVTGAGDTVVAAFTLALAADAEFRAAAMLSNLAGGIAVGKMGCATVTPQELLHAIKAF